MQRTVQSISQPPAQESHAYEFESKVSGFEKREEELGKGVALVIKTLQNTIPYPHQMNDALVKALLTQIQFAKNYGLLKELVQHDIETMRPLLERIRKLVEKTGNRELVLVGIFDRTTCHYQLVPQTISAPGKRTYVSPYKTVLEAARRIGQFNLTEKEIHEHWTIPRYKAYGKIIGVEILVSEWNEDGIVTVELLD